MTSGNCNKYVYLVNHKEHPVAVINWKSSPDINTIRLWYSVNYGFYEKDITVFPIRLPLIETTKDTYD